MPDHFTIRAYIDIGLSNFTIHCCWLAENTEYSISLVDYFTSCILGQLVKNRPTVKVYNCVPCIIIAKWKCRLKVICYNLFQEHVIRYLRVYDKNSGFEVKQCDRYSMEDNKGAKIASTKKWYVVQRVMALLGNGCICTFLFIVRCSTIVHQESVPPFHFL